MNLLDVPYVPQEGDRKCGAAVLCMVYASFGVTADQGEVWLRVRDARRRRSPGTTLSELSRDLHSQGFAALAIRGARPWELLQACDSPRLRVIVQHRFRYSSSGLHFSVLRGITATEVVIHDPYGRPDRRFQRDDFLALWGPPLLGFRASGYALLLAGRPGQMTEAERQVLPEAAPCPECGEPVRLKPWRDLLQPAHWRELICPSCGGSLPEETIR